MNFSILAGLFIHFFLLSCIAVGGFMATLPGMYSYLVESSGLLTAERFAATVAFGQSLPGPNVLVAAVLGWAAGGFYTFLATFIGTCIPFTTIALLAGRFVRKHAKSPGVRAYKAGMAPVAISLLFSTGWLLLNTNITNVKVVAWALIVTVVVWRTRFPLIGLIAMGGALGALGLLN
ncbi:MAG: chromate transporter [Burkholderiales bacterium]|nr:chromate transporter [Burkholderiales bacterium]